MDKKPEETMKIIRITEEWLKQQTNLPYEVRMMINTSLTIERDILSVPKKIKEYYG